MALHVDSTRLDMSIPDHALHCILSRCVSYQYPIRVYVRHLRNASQVQRNVTDISRCWWWLVLLVLFIFSLVYDGNRKWSEPEVVGTGSGRNRKWSEPEMTVTGDDRNRNWSEPKMIGTGNDRNRKWSEPEVITAGRYHNRNWWEPEMMGTGSDRKWIEPEVT